VVDARYSEKGTLEIDGWTTKQTSVDIKLTKYKAGKNARHDTASTYQDTADSYGNAGTLCC